MPQTAVELAFILRSIYETFIEDMDKKILEESADPGLANPDFIEGMLITVETAERLSGLSTLPAEVIQALLDHYSVDPDAE